MHALCRKGLRREQWNKKCSAALRGVPFVPKSFDDAMERGREFYWAGYTGAKHPHGGFAVSAADLASYNLGQRHAREFL